jgi:hypothetical protein
VGADGTGYKHIGFYNVAPPLSPSLSTLFTESMGDPHLMGATAVIGDWLLIAGIKNTLFVLLLCVFLCFFFVSFQTHNYYCV